MNIQYLKQQLIEYGFEVWWEKEGTLEGTYIYNIEKYFLEVIINIRLEKDTYVPYLRIQQRPTPKYVTVQSTNIHIGEITSMKEVENLIVSLKTISQNGEDL